MHPSKVSRPSQRPARAGSGRFARSLRRRGHHALTPEELATGAWRKRVPSGRPARSARPIPHMDLVAYLADQGFVRSRTEARRALVGGRVNVNGAVWAYPHVPRHLLEHDQFGRPRIMVEGTPDPRPTA